MKKWLSFSLVILMLFTWIPVIQAKAQPVHTAYGLIQKGKKPDKPEKAKKEKASGTVTAVDSASGKLTLDVKGKAVELLVNQTTKLKIPGWKTPALTDVWKGDAVKAEYTAAQGVLTAISIEVSKKKGNANGIVETIDLEGKTFAVSAKTVHVSDQTEIRLGEKKIVFADLLAGDQVSVSNSGGACCRQSGGSKGIAAGRNVAGPEDSSQRR